MKTNKLSETFVVIAENKPLPNDFTQDSPEEWLYNKSKGNHLEIIRKDFPRAILTRFDTPNKVLTALPQSIQKKASRFRGNHTIYELNNEGIKFCGVVKYYRVDRSNHGVDVLVEFLETGNFNVIKMDLDCYLDVQRYLNLENSINNFSILVENSSQFKLFNSEFNVNIYNRYNDFKNNKRFVAELATKEKINQKDLVVGNLYADSKGTMAIYLGRYVKKTYSDAKSSFNVWLKQQTNRKLNLEDLPKVLLETPYKDVKEVYQEPESFSILNNLVDIKDNPNKHSKLKYVMVNYLSDKKTTSRFTPRLDLGSGFDTELSNHQVAIEIYSRLFNIDKFDSTVSLDNYITRSLEICLSNIWWKDKIENQESKHIILIRIMELLDSNINYNNLTYDELVEVFLKFKNEFSVYTTEFNRKYNVTIDLLEKVLENKAISADSEINQLCGTMFSLDTETILNSFYYNYHKTMVALLNAIAEYV